MTLMAWHGTARDRRRTSCVSSLLGHPRASVLLAANHVALAGVVVTAIAASAEFIAVPAAIRLPSPPSP